MIWPNICPHVRGEWFYILSVKMDFKKMSCFSIDGWLVGSFNPSEKLLDISQIGSFPQKIGMKILKNILALFFQVIHSTASAGTPDTSGIVEFDEGKASVEIWKSIKNQTENDSLLVWKKKTLRVFRDTKILRRTHWNDDVFKCIWLLFQVY